MKMNARTWLVTLTGLVVLATATAVLGADSTRPPVVNPVGKWDDYELIIKVDVPLRGTLRHVYIDRASGAEARRTGTLPYGSKIVMRDYAGVADGHGGWKSEGNRLVPGKAVVVLVQQKEKGWGTAHPEAIRNGEWEYAMYTPDGKPINVDAEKACMPCHKRYADTDYTFVVGNFFADLKK
jgi:hypothetical protein